MPPMPADTNLFPPPVRPELPPFVKLRDPQTYRPCGLDLVGNANARDYWIDFFSVHIDTMLDLGVKAEGDTDDARQRATACADELRAKLEAFRADPSAFGPVSILILDTWRDQILRKHRFFDCFRDQKQAENEKMLPLLPTVNAELDALDDDPVQQLRAAVEGVFAGNVFDMGAKQTAALFKDKSPDFLETRSSLKPRPWRIDDFDSFAGRATERPYQKVIFFADNAGSDFVLGVVPMVRLLARKGATVVIACNEHPSLNDVTHNDVAELWPRLGFGGLPVSLVSTGTGEPLIDLRGVSDELNAAAADADLVILEGMGRGVESNLDADLTCDRLNLAMLKDELIAKTLGGEVYDCVCRFVRGR